MGNYESKRGETCVSMNAYFPGELYERIREIAFHEKRSMSNIVSKATEEFILSYKRTGTIPEGIKTDPHCVVYGMEERKKIGVYMSKEVRETLNGIASKERTTVAGIFRVLASQYADEYDRKQREAKMDASYLPQAENSFQMYIDLA